MAAVPTSSRSSGSGASSVTLLSSTTLGANGTFDVAAIDQTYNDLILVLMVRGLFNGTSDGLDLRLNNDLAGNYDFVRAYGLNTTFTGNALAGTGGVMVALIAANTATATWFTPVEIQIIGYASTTFTKTIISHFGGGTSTAVATLFAGTGSGVWHSTAAVNRIQLLGDLNATLLAGSTLRIYGRL